jgi:diadenosine tetraphosphate (Ap4A) HIT family hydrolase
VESLASDIFVDRLISLPSAFHQNPSQPSVMTSSESCPFCSIVETLPHPASTVDAEEPTHVVLSTEYALAFLDRLPLTKCHTLLIPRNHFEKLSDIPSEIAAELGGVLPILCRAIIEVSGADGFNVVQNNGISHRPCIFVRRG